MSRYNTYARRLDTTFRTARDEYAAAYDNLVQARQADTDAKAWRPMTPPRTDVFKTQALATEHIHRNTPQDTPVIIIDI